MTPLLFFALLAQQPGAEPAFIVASVKINNSGSRSSSSTTNKGQMTATNVSLQRLVERAYDVKPFQVSGPAWLEDVRVDVAAKFPPDTKKEDRPAMIRTLLKERFGFESHTITKEAAGYSLLVAKSGFKLKPTEPGGSGTNTNGGRVITMKATKMSMADLADFLARQLGEMVVDNTEVSGVYDFEMRWMRDDQAGSNNNPGEDAPSIFTALQDTLGLRLKPEKVSVPVIVVDHIERVPTEN